MKTTGLKLIGKGLFSKVYRLNENQVLVKSTCSVKECISMNWHDSENIFPVIERVCNDAYGNFQYIMPYYAPVKSLKEALDTKYYEIYKDLRSLSIQRPDNKHNLYDLWYKEFEKIKDSEYRDALISMLDNLSNYGSDIDFEISPRNVAVENGRLILLDVFFMRSQMEEKRFDIKSIRITK